MPRRSSEDFLDEWLPTVSEAIDMWVADLQLGGLSPRSVRTYLSLTKPIRSDSLITSLSPVICRQAVASRLHGSMSTARTTHAALASLCRWSLERGYFSISPMAGIPCPKVKPKIQRTLSADQRKALWANANDDMKLTLQLLATGLRATELVSLRWIDWDDQIIRVLFTKGGRPREISVNATLHSLLTASERKERCIVPITTQALRNRLLRLGRKAGVPGVRPHLFRHTWAVEWLLETNDAHTLQSLGGWHGEQMIRLYTASALQRSATAKARQVDLRLFGE